MRVLSLVTFVVLAVAVNAANQCPKEQEYDWEIELLLEHEDCDKFYKCTYGQPVEKLCPAGLFFNIDLWQCDWRYNVDCGDRNIPEDNGQGGGGDSGGGDAGGGGGDGGDGGGDGDGGAGGGDGDGGAGGGDGDGGAGGDGGDGGAGGGGGDGGAGGGSSSEEAFSCDDIPTVEPDFEVLDNGCPVNATIHWLLPHESNCNQFYYCIAGRVSVKDCPSSLHFNAYLQVCDLPQYACCATSFNKHLSGRVLLKK